MKQLCEMCGEKDNCTYIKIKRTDKCPDNDKFESGYEQGYNDAITEIEDYIRKLKEG